MDWKLGPPVLVGEKVLWSESNTNEPQTGTVKWIGVLPELNSSWCVGLELHKALPEGGSDGRWKDRKLFDCQAKHGVVVPITEIHKFYTRTSSRITASTESHSDPKLDDSQLGDFTRSNPNTESTKNKKDTQHRYSAFESKLGEWPFKNRSSHRRSTSRLEIKTKNQESRGRKLEEVFESLRPRQHHSVKTKSQDGKLSLKKKRRKRKSSQDRESRRHSKIEHDSRSTKDDLENYPNLADDFSNAPTLDSKAFLKELKKMNDVAGYFKEIKEDDAGAFGKPGQLDNQLDDASPYNLQNETGHGKEKKFFSFLKWFKKNKEDPLKIKDSSAASSPMFPRKRDSSCESVDTLFSTQTVRSFAYIPPNQYEPSAPPSSLLDFDKSFDENVFEDTPFRKNEPEETESIYDKKKKRRAPEPPRLSRENSLPTTLEHKKSGEELVEGDKTFHRRTVSESFKDKKAGAYCHVQGKRKAPLPPPASIYPNLQKINDNQYSSLYKKKKPAPPPPEVKKSETQSPSTNNEPKDIPKNTSKGHEEEKIADKNESENEDNKLKINQTPKEKLTKDVSLSPLPSRPWYKRSHRDSNGSNIIKKDLLKGFEKKKNKETDDWMPEVGFPRRSLSTDSTHNKFNIFARLDKNDDKKKEEKRKSQISILTNISELDREAAEIVRKEQAEEKIKIAANDAKYYSKDSPSDSRREATKDSNPEVSKPSPVDKTENRGAKPKTVYNQLKAEELDQAKPSEQKTSDKENRTEAKSSDKAKQPVAVANVLNDVTNADSSPKPTSNLNHFKVENKEVNYLNEPWVCQKCTLENPGWRVFCEICSSVKPRFLFNPTQKNQPDKLLMYKADKQKQDLKPEATKTKLEEPKVSPPKEKPKPEPTKQPEKPEPLTVETQEEPKPEPKTSPPKEVNKEPAESLDDLRKKRMNFFGARLGSSSEPEEIKPEVDPTNLIKVKEVKESLPKPKEEKVVENKEPKTQETTNEAQYGAIRKKQSPPKKEEIAEAYIVTKTIVLEDIIIKKGDKAPKVSAAVQTRSSLPVEPGPSGIRPPPRTKKSLEPLETKPNKKKPDSPLDLSPSDVQDQSEKFNQDVEELTNKLTQAKGLADFKANIETMAPNTEMNTVAVNRLLRRLEAAINGGDHFVAAGLAKELALMKINCSVTRQATEPVSPTSQKITIDLYVEDKESHQGPIPIQVSPAMTLLQLKNKVQEELGIPVDVQRWILGKKLATDDSKTLEYNDVKTDSSSIFLYLVGPDKKVAEAAAPEKQVEKNESKNPESTQPTEKPPPPKGKGWYYNYEEDHYSYCEDSEDDSRDPSPVPEKPQRNKYQKLGQTAQNDVKTQPPDEKPKVEKPAVELQTRENENTLEKELKLISVNSVKQKVERLNRTFAENSNPVRVNSRSSMSPETWKCVACTFVNSPGKFNCSACNAKKVASRLALANLESKGPQISNEPWKRPNDKPGTSDGNVHYKELMQLQDADLVPNSEPFNCSICMVDYSPGEGVTLKDCLHTFCKTCLINTVQYSEDAEVKCPYLDETYSCTSVLQQREIKALVPKGIFELHLAKSVKEAENKIGNAFHCKTPDCKGWCIYEDNVNEFHCPVCKFINCLTCQAIHTGINCRQYQERMKDASETDVDAKKTREMLEEMVQKGEAMACPKCQVVLMKKWGCDWLRCSMCKTEICWVTRGFRWGPGGKGDTSGGCKCGEKGIKCHPKCNYCH